MLVLAGDVGGTNTRLALFQGSSLIFKWTCSSRQYGASYEALAAFIKDAPINSLAGLAACIAVAGVIEDSTVARGTNIPWVIRCDRIRKETGIRHCTIINDFEAAAWGVTVLDRERSVQIGGNTPDPSGIKAVLGAGTGLGEALAVPGRDGSFIIVSTEGGHCGFAPESPQEIELLSWLMQRFGHVSVEHLLSGQGLVNIHTFLSGNPCSSIPDGPDHDRMAPEITERALDGTDELCIKTVEMFCRIYGSEAGNLALKSLPSGGVYVAGGIAPAILPFLKRGDFRTAFEDKGCMKKVLKNIPLLVVQEPDLGLIGAAVRAGMDSHNHPDSRL